MLFLKKIEIKNFKSFTHEVIRIDEITSIVGANESGKTNLLEAIYHLSIDKRMKVFTPDDLRIGAPDYPNGEIIIEYEIELNAELLKYTDTDEVNFSGRILNLKKRGKPKGFPKWEVSSNIQAGQIPDIIFIKNKKALSEGLKNDGFKKAEIDKLCKGNWFFNNPKIDLRKGYFRKLLIDKKIDIIKKEQKLTFINDVLKESVFRNINLFKWKYKEEDFIQQIINIEDLIANPGKYKTVVNMFTISGWKKEEFDNKLKQQNPSVYTNLLNDVKRHIDSLIKNQWSSHKGLTINLQHNGEQLSILLNEQGASTPPEYRSDGLKWFLTFLINFRAQGKNISNYILLIDEPGLYLHPKGQKDALQEIEILSKKNQIIYTTHQTFLINKNKPERVRIIRRVTDRAGNLAFKPFYASKVTNSIATKDILTDNLLREALGFKLSDNSPINDKNVLVEGFFDREVFNLMNEYFEILDMNEISIISCGRASEIAKHCSLYKGNDLRVICFYDSDIAGKSAYKLNKNVLMSEKLQVSDFMKGIENETIEDLFSERIFQETLSYLSNKWNIKSSVRINKPRMIKLKNEKWIEDINKIERKHELESLLFINLKDDLRKNEKDYSIFRDILIEMKKRFT